MKKKILIISIFLITILKSYATNLNPDDIIDKITIYPLEKYNDNEVLTLRNELSTSKKENIKNNIFQNIDFSDKNIPKLYMDNSLRDEKEAIEEKYLIMLLDTLRNGKFLQTHYSANFQKNEQDRFHYGEISDSEININDFHRMESIERYIKRATGVPTELRIELVKQNKDYTGNIVSLYNLIITQKKLDNRLVAVIPYEVDVKNQIITRVDSDFVFITPMKIYNGISEFFNTFAINKNRHDYRFETGRLLDEKDKKYTVTILNKDTLEIANTRVEKKFYKYIDNLLNNKMGNIYKNVIKSTERKKGEYITEEEYKNIINKAHRILHNYQYAEITKRNSLKETIIKKINYSIQEKKPYKENMTLRIDIQNYNKEQEIKKLTLKDELFKEISLNDKEVYQRDKNGYLIDKLKDEYSEYFKKLLDNITSEKLINTDISINSIEKYIQTITKKNTQKSIELVNVKGKKYFYHIIVNSCDNENKNVFILPVMVDTEGKKIIISNEKLIFKTPWNVHIGLADFLYTYSAKLEN